MGAMEKIDERFDAWCFDFCEVTSMKVNQIDFKRTSVLFPGCADPMDVNEIYIDGQKLGDIFSRAAPLWTEELYPNLMRSPFLRAEPFVVAVCKCGCLGCGDLSVHIDETEKFVIWHDFIELDDRPMKPGLVFIFDRKQYYAAVDTLLNGVGKKRAIYYAGDLLVSCRDERRADRFWECLDSACDLYCDFESMEYLGRGNVLKAFADNLVGKFDVWNEENDYFYSIRNGDRAFKEDGFDECFLEIYHYKSYEPVIYVAFELDTDGKIETIFLRRSRCLV